MAEYHCTLAKPYHPDKHDVLGWWVSEKLDGVRALWCPTRQGFFSRSNKPLVVPPSWLGRMRNIKVKLDGEFFMGRGQFQRCASAVRKKNPTEEQFEGVEYVVFDSCSSGDHETRLGLACRAALGLAGVRIHHHEKVTCMDRVAEQYAQILRCGGEGLMFRCPHAPYEWKRTGNLLKWKDQIDGIATVTGVVEGEGKHEGRMGALECIDQENGVHFRVGTGFSDLERQWWFDNDPKREIRWRAMERTKDGVPRHPSYAGIYTGE